MKHRILSLCLILALLLGMACTVACSESGDTNPPADGNIGPTPPSGEGSVNPTPQAPATQVPESEASSRPSAKPAIPDFSVLDADGNTVKLSDLIGKPILLNFWATWCPPCKAEMPDLQKAYETYGKDIHFVMVNLTDGTRDTVDVVKQFVSDNGYTFPVYFDTQSSAAIAYRISSIPTTYLISAEGQIVDGHTGMMTADQIEEAIDKLLE